MMKRIPQVTRDRLVGNAILWAMANRSDPFALNVALSQIDCGICRTEANSFSAEPLQVWKDEPRSKKRFYTVTEYKNMRRP